MATRKYMEDSINAVYNYLNSNLNTKLAAIRTERSEDYPANIGHLHKGHTRIQKWPKVLVLADNTIHDYGYDVEPLSADHWLIHSLYIYVEHKSASEDALEKTLYRYTEAISRLQEDDDTFNDAFVDVRLGEEDYTPMVEEEKGQMIRGVLIQVVCKIL